MAFDFQPIPLVKEGEGPTILSASFANRIIEATNALWKIQGTNGVTVTKSRHDVVIDVPDTDDSGLVCVEITPALDHKALKNWIVIRGSVDLVGLWPGNTPPGFNDVYPGSGYYIDMAGTTSPTNGRLRSRRNQSLTAGYTYRLDYQVAGNHRGGGNNSVQVLITDRDNNNAIIYDETHTVSPYAEWSEYYFDYIPSVDMNIAIEFVNADATPTGVVGALIRGMRFRNLSRNVVMIGDELRCEGSEDVSREIDGPVYDILVYRTNTDQAAATNGALDRWAARGVFLCGSFGALNSIELYNQCKLIPFQGKTVVDWPYTFGIDFEGASPFIGKLDRFGDNVLSLVQFDGTITPAKAMRQRFDPADGQGCWIATDFSGTIPTVPAGYSQEGLLYPVVGDSGYIGYYDGGALSGGTPTTHQTANTLQILGVPISEFRFWDTFAVGYNRIAGIGFGRTIVGTPDVYQSQSVFSFDWYGDVRAGSGGGGPWLTATMSTAFTPRGIEATGICAVEGWSAFYDTVDRLGYDGLGNTSVLEGDVPNTAFCVTYRNAIDYYYWHPNPADTLGTTWYHYDYNTPPASRATLVDWRLQAAPVMTPNTGFPASPLAGSFWTGAGADCACYSPVFTGWRTNGTGEFIAIGNNSVIDGGATTWNGARASDFQGIYAIGLDGNAISPFHVELTFTGLSPAGVAGDIYNHPTILLISSDDRIWFTGPIATINGNTVDPWQLYFVYGDGSQGGQVGIITGGIIHAMKEFKPGQYILGGEFTTYRSSAGTDRESAFLVFIDETGEEIDLTW